MNQLKSFPEINKPNQYRSQPVIQPKLKIGQPGNKYEQEADAVANQVMRMSEGESLRMQPMEEEEEMMQMQPLEEEELLQTKIQLQPIEEEEEELMMKKIPGHIQKFENSQSQASPETSSLINKTAGGGQTMNPGIKKEMGNKIGANFQNVKIHNDSNAHQMSQNLGAKAFTVGNDIYFNEGGYSPSSSTGKQLLAHELTHVVQQNHGISKKIQRMIGDGHDLTSPRFATDTTLQNIYDGTGTLKNGDENESVRKVQHGIHDSGIRFRGHGIDGKFGDLTQRWVIRFQTRNRITGDPAGEVGDATIEKLDQLYPATALPATAGGAFSFPVMLQILCAWNSAMIRDLRNISVHLVADLEWADERFDGSAWVANSTPGEGETDGLAIYIATDNTNENVAKALYHEYQHARAPYVFRSRTWADEENYAFRVETDWAIARGITPDPTLTTTDPGTGAVVADPAGISSTVESYPGLDAANPGEVIGKVGANRVRVRMPNGSVRVRNAVLNDTVEGPRRITRPHRIVRDAEWRC